MSRREYWSLNLVIVRALVAAIWLLSVGYINGLVSYRITKPINMEHVGKEEGFAYLGAIGVTSQPVIGPDPKLELLENGQAIHTRNDFHNDIRKFGGGLYSHWTTNLYFSTKDSTDPRTNSRRYEVRYSPEYPVPLLLAISALFLLLWLPIIAECVTAIDKVAPARMSIVLIFLTVIYRLWFIYSHPDPSYGGHMVKGMPISDASGWDALASDYAQGLRANSAWGCWNARRPFYYWLFGAIYALTGPAIVVTQIVKFLLAVISTWLIFDTVRRLTLPIVGVVAALVHILAMEDSYDVLMTRTEGVGYFLSNVALWLFVCGAQALTQERETVPPWKESSAIKFFLCAGVFLGIANLTRPLNIGGVVLLPIILAWCSPPKLSEVFLPRKRVLICGTVFVLGAVGAILPWIVRQYLVWGILSISDNSAEMLLGASSPQFGSWTSAISRLYHGDEADLGTRHRFFNELASQSVRENFQFYLGNAALHIYITLQKLALPAWVFIVAAIYSLLSLTRPLQRLFAVSVFLICAGVVTYYTYAAQLLTCFWLVAIVVALVLRAEALYLAGLVVPSVVVLGMCASPEDRMIYSLNWQSVALGGWGTITIAAAIFNRGGLSHTLGVGRVRFGSEVVRFRVNYLLRGLIALLLLGTAISWYRYFTIDRAIQRGGGLVVDSQRAIEQVVSNPSCAKFVPLRQHFKVFRGRVRSGYTIHLGINERVDHWSTLFKLRPYRFTIFQLSPEVPGTYLTVPGELPDGKEFVVVGVSRTESWEQSLEIVDILSTSEAGNESLLNCGGGAVEWSEHAKFISSAIEGSAGSK